MVRTEELLPTKIKGYIRTLGELGAPWMDRLTAVIKSKDLFKVRQICKAITVRDNRKEIKREVDSLMIFLWLYS